MTFFTTFVVIGCGLGPLVSGFISQNVSWRWVFYASALEIAGVVLAMFFFFRETRGNIALRKKADLLNRWYQACEDLGHSVTAVDVKVPSEKSQGTSQTKRGRVRWRVKADVERQTIRQMIQASLYLPFYLLFTEPVVFFFSLWMAFAWAILWIMYGALPDMYQSVYGFNQQQQGATFASVIIGAMLSAVLSITYEKYHTRTDIADSTPEHRLYFPGICSILLPIGLFCFGWTSREDIHWIVPTLAVCCLTMGIFSIILAVINYLADTYHQYSSSAMAAMSFCRNISGGAFVGHEIIP
jgi:MFS family permease